MSRRFYIAFIRKKIFCKELSVKYTFIANNVNWTDMIFNMFDQTRTRTSDWQHFFPHYIDFEMGVVKKIWLVCLLKIYYQLSGLISLYSTKINFHWWLCLSSPLEIICRFFIQHFLLHHLCPTERFKNHTDLNPALSRG